MQTETVKRLHDALSAAQQIQEVASVHEAETREIQQLRLLAIERLLAIVGEALNRAIQSDSSLKALLSEAPLIIGMRNRIIHGYDSIRSDIIWDTTRHDIPRLVEQLTNLLADESPPTT